MAFLYPGIPGNFESWPHRKKILWVRNYDSMKAFLAYNFPDGDFDTNTPIGKSNVNTLVMDDIKEAAKRTKEEIINQVLVGFEAALGRQGVDE